MKKQLIILLFLLLFTCGCSNKPKELVLDENGYEVENLYNYKKSTSTDGVVKNVILLIGDGMGENHVKVAKMILENNNLDLDKMEYKGEVITSCLNNYVTDSAAAATAFATGVKTNYEVVGKDANGNDLKTILDYAKENKKTIGIVTDKGLTDATPAAFSVHLNNRYLETDTIPLQQIASNIDVFIGGGSSDYVSYQKDIEKANYQYITTKEELLATNEPRIFATFSSGRLMSHSSVVPTLAEMTFKAINSLSQNKEGFFLMVEAGQIDNRCNDGDINEMARGIQDLDKALRVALNFARRDGQTLVVVVADHETGGLVIKDGVPDETWFTEATRYHTPTNVLIYSYGLRSEIFDNVVIDNTEVFYKLMDAMALEQ